MRRRSSGLWCAAAALITAALQLVSGLVPPAVSADSASYPFTPGVQIVFQLAFAVLHLPVLAALIVLARTRPFGRGRAGRFGAWTAALGYAFFPFAELYEASVAHLAQNDPEVDLLAALFGPGTLLFGIGALVAGTAILRARRWSGRDRLSLFASGVVMVLVVLPSQFGTNRIVTDFALTLWALTLAWVGWSLARSTRVGSSAAIAAARG